jgi:hypothetical protein
LIEPGVSRKVKGSVSGASGVVNFHMKLPL